MFKHPIGMFAEYPHAAAVFAFAAALGMLSACGGSDEAATPPEAKSLESARPTFEGARVSGRDDALQIVARGVVAPLYYCELAHAVLVRVFEMRSIARGADLPVSTGDRWVVTLDAQPLGAGAVENQTGVDIEAADNAEALILRGEAGLVRAVLRFERFALGAAQVDGAITLEVSRTVVGTGWTHRCQAEALSITDGHGTRHWSYLDAAVDAQRFVQRLTVVSDVPMDGAARVWIDVTSSTPGRLNAAWAGATLSSGRYVATGVIGFLKARLTLQVSADGGWTIDVDNDKDDRIDFVVRASADEARALVSAQ